MNRGDKMSISSTVKNIMPYLKTASGYVLHRLSSQAVEMDDGTTLEAKVTSLNNLISQKLNSANVVNNLTTTNSGYALDARQGKALNDSITSLNSALAYIHTAETTDGSAFSKNFLGIGIQDPNVERNKRAYFIISPDDRGEFSNVPPDLFFEDTYSVGVREVYHLGTTLIMVKITEISPRPGRQYYRTYNSGSWNSSGWQVISPE